MVVERGRRGGGGGRGKLGTASLLLFGYNWGQRCRARCTCPRDGPPQTTLPPLPPPLFLVYFIYTHGSLDLVELQNVFRTASKYCCMRVDGGINSWGIFVIIMKVRAVVERGDKILLSDPGSGLRLGRKKEK